MDAETWKILGINGASLMAIFLITKLIQTIKGKTNGNGIPPILIQEGLLAMKQLAINGEKTNVLLEKISDTNGRIEEVGKRNGEKLDTIGSKLDVAMGRQIDSLRKLDDLRE